MLGSLLQPSHLVILLVVFSFFFGGKLLSNFGKGFADGVRNFRNSVHSSKK
jgi:Sec-independent protein translocase protein TatA